MRDDEREAIFPGSCGGGGVGLRKRDSNARKRSSSLAAVTCSRERRSRASSREAVSPWQDLEDGASPWAREKALAWQKASG
jgi:hypothetical protein